MSMFLGGINRDGVPKLFMIEPSGMITDWKAHAVGYLLVHLPAKTLTL